MSCRWSLVLKTLVIFLFGIGLVFWVNTAALAQCGDNPPKSSCITCHTKEYPVYQNGEWHGIHALKDCCTSCHGGNCSAQDKDLAHFNLVADPLEDIYTDCHGCHPDDYALRAARFAIVLGVTPGSSPTATAVPAATAVDHAIMIQLPTNTSPSSVQPLVFILSMVGLLILFLVGLLTLAHRLRLPEPKN